MHCQFGCDAESVKLIRLVGQAKIGKNIRMTRSELVDRLTSRFPQLTEADAKLALGEILSAIQKALAEGRRAEIRDFGTFTCIQREGRLGRNPKTGQAVTVPTKCIPHFKAGKSLRNRVMPP